MLLKRLLISLSLILICYFGNAQFVNKQTVGSTTTNYNSKGGLSSDSGIIISSQFSLKMHLILQNEDFWNYKIRKSEDVSHT